MTISQALKEKNRAAGRIKNLQTQIKAYNKVEDGEVKDLDSRELLVQLETEWAGLILLKSKLAQANVNIAEKLIRLAEAKAELAFWNEFVGYAGQKEEKASKSVYKKGQYEEVEYIIRSTIPSKEVLERQEKSQKEIESLQDEIDNYNATTQI